MTEQPKGNLLNLLRQLLAAFADAFHECDYDPVAVQPQRGTLGPASTVILWRCDDCGDVETETIDGQWTLAQVLGEHGAEVEMEEVRDER